MAATAAPPPPSTSTPQQRPPLTIHDVPNGVLVSIFAALDDPDWVRRTVPLVHPSWAELYRSKDASPLHETLKVDFQKEVERAALAAIEGWGRRRGPAAGAAAPRFPSVHASSVILWAEARAGSVRKLSLCRMEEGALEDFSFEDMGRLVAAAAAPSLTELYFELDVFVLSQVRSELRRRRGGRYLLPDLGPFWEAIRGPVARAGRLSSLKVRCADFSSSSSERDLERSLEKLAGSLETLVLWAVDPSDRRFPRPGDPGIPREGLGLPRFPEALCGLSELRRLDLLHHQRIEAIPARISSLQKLRDLDLKGCGLSSLPKELGELSGLTKLNLSHNPLGRQSQVDEAFPAALAGMKSLRELQFFRCGLRAVPAFVGELASLEILELSGNEGLGDAPQLRAFPAALAKMKSLRSLHLDNCNLRAVPAFIGELPSLERLHLHENENLGDAPQLRAFPAALGNLRSLRELYLVRCGLRALPILVGRLESLEVLDLRCNDFEVDALALGALATLSGRSRRLRDVDLQNYGRPWNAESLAHLGFFKQWLRRENPGAELSY